MSEERQERANLSEMGIWGRGVKVELGERYEEVWVQTLGDRTEALERGHDAMQRKLLEFHAGGERAKALTEALMLAPAADLAELALEGERPQFEARLRREMPDPVAPRQDRGAGERDEDFARREAEHAARCRELRGQRAQRLAELLEARRKELVAMDRAELVELARPRRIDLECWNAFARACDDWVLFRAVRRAGDPERPYFEAIAQVQALHPAVKDQLRRAYQELEAAHGESLPKA
jgi:hypothetical protein